MLDLFGRPRIIEVPTGNVRFHNGVKEEEYNITVITCGTVRSSRQVWRETSEYNDTTSQQAA